MGYTKGFFRKCAEYGIGGRRAVGLYKLAATVGADGDVGITVGPELPYLPYYSTPKTTMYGAGAGALAGALGTALFGKKDKNGRKHWLRNMLIGTGVGAGAGALGGFAGNKYVDHANGEIDKRQPDVILDENDPYLTNPRPSRPYDEYAGMDPGQAKVTRDADAALGKLNPKDPLDMALAETLVDSAREAGAFPSATIANAQAMSKGVAPGPVLAGQAAPSRKNRAVRPKSPGAETPTREMQDALLAANAEQSARAAEKQDMDEFFASLSPSPGSGPGPVPDLEAAPADVPDAAMDRLLSTRVPSRQDVEFGIEQRMSDPSALVAYVNEVMEAYRASGATPPAGVVSMMNAAVDAATGAH